MGKKHITSDYRLVLRSSVGGNPGLELDRLFIEARRHLGHLATIAKEYKTETVCEFCNYPWDPQFEHYNGCCEKDEEAARGTEEWKQVNEVPDESR